MTFDIVVLSQEYRSSVVYQITIIYLGVVGSIFIRINESLGETDDLLTHTATGE